MSAIGRGVHVKAAAGLAPWGVCYCPTCPHRCASGYEQDFKYPWSLKLNCNNCGTTWWVCRLCPSQRRHMTENNHLSRHNRQFHKKEVAAVQTEEPIINTTAMSRIHI